MSDAAALVVLVGTACTTLVALSWLLITIRSLSPA